ncbi:MAG TPA: glycosyltransferase family 39 protein [Ktedonobacterales bacterium]|jgi:4-amino-4-deoxy-L-arabinose transferase-like glycosyltransferase|nr:glycosyltransferase family 39 protein [Ktedonobacterales bacterium]
MRDQQWQASNLSRSQMAALASIGLVALALRVAWITAIPNTPFSDFASDRAFARQFASGVFPQGVTFQGAGYPLALALVYRLTGSSGIMVGKVENVILSMATLALCAYIFFRLTPQRWLAISATAIVALLPAYIAYTSVLGTEVVFTFCLAAAIALQLARWDWRLRYPLMGLLIGYGVITKPYLLVYPFVAALIYWLTEKDARQTVRLFVITMLCALVVVAPITWENYLQLHRFILNTYNGSFVLFVNSNSDNTTGAWMPFSAIHISASFREQLLQHGVTYPNVPVNQGYAPVDPLFMAQAQRWIITHPAQYAHLGVLRLRNTFFNGAWDVRGYTADGLTDQQIASSLPLRLFFRLANLSLVTLSVGGFIVAALGCARAVRALVRRDARMAPVLAYPALLGVYAIATFFATEGQPRYSFPSLMIFAFASVYLLSLAGASWRQLMSARFARQPAPPATNRTSRRSALEQETLKRPRVKAPPPQSL